MNRLLTVLGVLVTITGIALIVVGFVASEAILWRVIVAAFGVVAFTLGTAVIEEGTR